ncbi:hypothetical protein E3E12_07920 [Formicincola oecophyllae]|uniref:Uncharacterized protein n=1 Tax=Formicincola oecophyllae TaxID=2558361 RepID=A0A4Y6U9Q9_9PROT|nr:hypothetical protein [Formicincola oecophyllae]QDH14122.1 hypothetical protein E3E12_07920 [Formicincola oecophyllae]
MAKLITSADVVATMTVAQLFSAPIILENWSSDNAWEAEDQVIGDSRMSLDKKLNKGYVPAPVELTMTFEPNSESLLVFDALAAASKAGRTVYDVSLELAHKSLGQKFSFLDGHVIRYKPNPGGAKLLKARPVRFRFADIIPAGM